MRLTESSSTPTPAAGPGPSAAQHRVAEVHGPTGEREEIAPTPRTAFKRLPERGTHDREAIWSILDDACYCHVGFVTEDGPIVIPTSFGRDDDVLYIHGSPASRMMRTLKRGVPVCATVTILDGLVLARSAIHHSVNYRSVVIFAEATEVTGLDAKRSALLRIVDHVVPGRSADARPPTDKEVKGTTVLALGIDEASAKVRTGGPHDEQADLALPVWAGVVPISAHRAAPVAEPDLDPSVPLPGYLSS